MSRLDVLLGENNYVPHNGCISAADLRRPAFQRILDDIHAFMCLARHKRPSFKRCKGRSWLEPVWMGAYRHWEFPWAVLNAALRPGMRVLDSGSGTSPFQFYLATLGVEVYSNDCISLRSKQFHRLARALGALGIAWRPSPTVFNRKHNRGYAVNARYAVATTAALPYREDTFDRVFSISVLEHMDDETLRNAMREMERVLKPGGLLVLTFDFHRDPGPYVGFTAEEYQRKILGAFSLKMVGEPPDLVFPAWPEYKAELHELFEHKNPNTACGVLFQKS